MIPFVSLIIGLNFILACVAAYKGITLKNDVWFVISTLASGLGLVLFYAVMLDIRGF